jgi:hypothetical protein
MGLERHPIWRIYPAGAAISCELSAFDPVEPHQSHRTSVDPGQHFAGAQRARQNLLPCRRRRTVELDRQHAALDHAAALHPRSGLLADEAALLEIDAIQQIEIRFERVAGLLAPVGRARNAER